MSIKLGPERILHFHTTDPADLGITLTHTPTTLAMGISTGYVRITSLSSDGGMVQGDARLNDVVVEAAGVNMRRPISEGMWRLTLGLMEVAPRPLEVVVAAEVDEDASPEQEGRDELSNQITGMEDEKQVGYYQLVTPSKYSVPNDPVLSAKLYHLENSCDFTHGSPAEIAASPDGANSPDSSLDQSPVVVRNPFLDPNRFGPERTIVFRTESLGVKLHRSASEGIVHVLHVTSYEPPKGSTMLPPRDGDLEEGDAIMEVGGVDLRNQCIGRIEWADMVHFIKYVDRPLEMVVAKDSMYTRERVGIVAVMAPLKEEGASDMRDKKDESSVSGETSDNCEAKTEDENDETQVLDAENNNGQDDVNPDEWGPSQDPVGQSDGKSNGEEKLPCNAAAETIVTDHLQDLSENCHSVVIDNACNTVTDGICSTPCVAASAKVEMENCATPGAAADTASEEDSGKQKNSPSMQKVVSPTVNDHSWIKSRAEQSEAVEVKSAKPSPSRTPKTLFHRTHPAAENTSIIVLSPDANSTTSKVESPDFERETTPETPVSPGAKSTTEKFSVISPERKSVAELRGLFSPIKLPDETKRRPLVSSDEKCEIAHAARTIEVNPVTDSYNDGNNAADIASRRADEDNEFDDKHDSSREQHDDDTRSEQSDAIMNVLNVDSPSREKKISAHCSQVATDIDNAVGLTTHAPGDILMENKPNEENNDMKTSTAISPVLTADSENTTDVDRIADAPSVDPNNRSDNDEDVDEQKPTLSDDVLDLPLSNQSQQMASEPTPHNNIKDSYTDELGPTPEKPFDETANSSLHEVIVNDLASEFTSPSEKSLPPSDSRDDTEQKKHRENAAKKERKSSDETMSTTICPKPEKPGTKLFSTPATTRTAFCGSLFVIDDSDSPFCGNIKFSSSVGDNIPASALFSQAFVVQKTGSEEHKAPPVTDHIRWESTNSPLFVTKKNPRCRSKDPNRVVSIPSSRTNTPRATFS
eukprot:CCRYP_009428-RA/>CCRYP_009428-RA protein AED:0.01 eAED:0.01 QI:248/-1/1/1/-1/1/1/856/983